MNENDQQKLKEQQNGSMFGLLYAILIYTYCINSKISLYDFVSTPNCVQHVYMHGRDINLNLENAILVDY